MKIVLLTLAVLLLAVPVLAQQGGSIGIFANMYGSQCDYLDMSGLFDIYVVHMFTPGSTGSQFRVDVSPGVTMTLLQTNYMTGIYIGDPFTGIQIAYGSCLSSPIVLIDFLYWNHGTSEPCSYFQIAADPAGVSPGIYSVDCGIPGNIVPATGGRLIVNPQAGCYCNVPAEDTSWGQIKSLYQ